MYFVDNGETVIVAKPLHTMGPPFPLMEVSSIFLQHLTSLPPPSPQNSSKLVLLAENHGQKSCSSIFPGTYTVINNVGSIGILSDCLSPFTPTVFPSF